MKSIVAQRGTGLARPAIKPPAKYRHIQTTRTAAHAVLLIIVMFIAGYLTSVFLAF